MAEPAAPPVPTLVKAPRGGREMRITWNDGHESLLPHDILRGYCPCATCQGHGGKVHFIADGSRDLRELEQVGNYALSLSWGDMHSTGIYSYRYLRMLCQCEVCRPAFPPAGSPIVELPKAPA